MVSRGVPSAGVVGGGRLTECEQGNGAPFGHGKSFWANKGGKTGYQQGSAKGKGTCRGKTQFSEQCSHCGEWGGGHLQNSCPRKEGPQRKG